MENKLTIKWSKKENDLIVHYPSSVDGSLMYDFLISSRHHPLPLPHDEWEDGLVKQLEARGYDIKTLKFSIEKKKDGT